MIFEVPISFLGDASTNKRKPAKPDQRLLLQNNLSGFC